MSRDHVGLKIVVALYVAYFDLVSDLVLIREYSQSPSTHDWMWLSISFIAISVGFQGAIALYNSRGSGWRRELYEFFLAVRKTPRLQPTTPVSHFFLQ